jgi:hypothetical protein
MYVHNDSRYRQLLHSGQVQVGKRDLFRSQASGIQRETAILAPYLRFQADVRITLQLEVNEPLKRKC